ncbi:endolytic transglycosylase MltG [Geodermatophilus nigrescens]
MTPPVPPYGRGRPVSDGVGGTAAAGWPAPHAGVGPATTWLPVGPSAQRPGGTARGASLLDRDPYPVTAGRHAAPDGDPSRGEIPAAASGDDRTGPLSGGARPGPGAEGLPPRPQGAWSRLSKRPDADPDATVAAVVPREADAPTEAHPLADAHGGSHDDPHHVNHHHDHHEDDDATGGLDVLGAGGREERRRGRRGRRDEQHHDDPHHDPHHDDHHDEHDHPATDEHPVLGGGRGTRTGRRRRSPLANLVALLVLAALVAGIVFGGRALIGLVNPEAEDFAGSGTGTVDVRVGEGDTLSDIARALVEAGVIASAAPFVEAAETEPAAMGIQPGVYSLRSEMSGAAALDLLLDPAARQVSRVTVPEGFTVAATLQRIAETTGLPIEELQAAAADPAALGLPAYANGQLEGFLFPATYDVEPDTTAVDVLRAMVSRFTETAADMQLEQRAAAAGRSVYDVVIVASMVQSETRLDEERPNVAQVVYNRLNQGIALGIDATLAYGLGKNGNDLTVTDLRTDGPYNTRTRPGLVPTPISSPGEASLEAALAPSTGDLLYYVLESQDGRHFFTASYEEFMAARQRCADAGLGCGG